MACRIVCCVVCVSCLLAAPAAALAQLIPGWDTKQFTFERIDADTLLLQREVEISGVGANAGQQIFADELRWNLRTGEFVAVGNVLIVSPTARVSAERVTFNTKTSTGTFETAFGMASLGERGLQDRSMFGALEPDVYFYGERIDKIGPDKYRIRQGGFTTCVQPTPRWDIVSNTATVDLGDYAMLRNAVIRVKDVPVFYLPILYYPIQDDGRSTGFLMPTYGRSTYRGQSLSNAFFWAINRSQDLTLMHDWFTSRGQGMGSEYRYVAAAGSEGSLRAYWLTERAGTLRFPGGGSTQLPARRSYEIAGGLAQRLPAGFQARARIDYFSDLTTQQLYNTNIYEASRRQRSIGGSVSGEWAGVSLTGNYQYNELFASQTASIVNGFAPSISANLSSRRVANLPVYVSVTSDASRILFIDRQGEVERDFSVGRFDLQPSVRAALTRWQFFTINASAALRNTYFTQSLDADSRQVPIGLTRRYLDLRTDLVGPVFSRVFTPGNALADRLKHIVEPAFSIQRITDFENQSRVPRVGGSYDYIVGGTTRLNYGVTNRILVRKAPDDPTAPPAASAARELLSVGLSQSYYTNPLAGIYDVTYQSSESARRLSNFSPVALSVRGAPTAFTAATMRVEYDTQRGLLQSINALGSSTYRAAQATVGWSARRGSQDRTRPMEKGINAGAMLNLLQGKTGGSYTLDWDITRGYIIQQRWTGFYNAQCCGIVMEYQEYSFPPGLLAISEDRRFNLSFTLAGIGTFSNFFGAFGGR